MPKLSIIIPTFNSAPTLSRTLDSIVSQSFQDWEIIIMDGVSIDETVNIARSYNDNRFKIQSEPDLGIYDAMNKGIKLAQGQWLYFIGSDDWLLHPDTLQTLFSHNIDQYDVVYGDVESPHLSAKHSGQWSLETLDYNRCHQGIFYKKTTFKKIGFYNIEYKVLADYDLNLKWFLSSKLKSKYLPIKIAHYSDGGYSSTTDDRQFSSCYPYLKLTYGWRVFSKPELFTFAKSAIKTRSRKHITRWLHALALYILLYLIIHKP